MKQIHCLIRKEWVAATPEEQVRQGILKYMISSLGYPKESLTVEKALDQMPHLSTQGLSIPDRRADIVCFAKGVHNTHTLYPLLLIECKAVKLSQPVVLQVIGYNQYLKAHFVCLANKTEVRTGWFNPDLKHYQFVSTLPTYQQLLQSIDCKI
jgi:hypothetical protein